MPVSVVVGGQYGSEGKGKTSLHIARTDPTVAAIIRVGGSNSGHIGVSKAGEHIALRQLPAGGIDGDHEILLPAGSYIDVELLLREIDLLGYDPARLMISPFAHIITADHKRWEAANGLGEAIGSTLSGTGAAVLSRVARGGGSLPDAVRAEDVPQLASFIGSTTTRARELLKSDRRLVIEGTQGFGLSSLHAEAWPKATSRDTTAAGFLAEAGLSPFDVDDVILVIRCHPIRVAGRQSGPLPHETTWDEIARRAGIDHDIREFTTVTKKERRVGDFDPEIVRQAIAVNRPSRIVLNHLDYVAAGDASEQPGAEALDYVQRVEGAIGQRIDLVGTSPASLIDRASLRVGA
ncbi:adenylosuccinate synthetase [Sphingomonas sp. PAMC 26605]|uniref:adenylosuccinate synthetase n=1 Tax=Sphingomonas sp. PAMC 26605 TaxID=1112214 RepID=UPI00026CD1E5|nr:adenylosuccinate synthetase [Sphingomonas sp. PAMC 26605]